QRIRNRGFAGRGKTGEPQAQRLLELELGAGVLVNVHRLWSKSVTRRSASDSIPDRAAMFGVSDLLPSIKVSGSWRATGIAVLASVSAPVFHAGHGTCKCAARGLESGR